MKKKVLLLVNRLVNRLKRKSNRTRQHELYVIITGMSVPATMNDEDVYREIHSYFSALLSRQQRFYSRLNTLARERNELIEEEEKRKKPRKTIIEQAKREQLIIMQLLE